MSNEIVFFELKKILQRRIPLALLITTTIFFPLIIMIVSHLSAVSGEIPEGLFPQGVAFLTITLSQSYFFLPVWIILLIGFELSGGHVNRVVFIRSRKFFFLSKICYCGIITILFSLLGTAALVISIETAPFEFFTADASFYFGFLLQFVLATLSFSIFLLGVVFLVRSPLIAFVIYIGWHFLESVLYSLGRILLDLDFWWLPIHLIKTLYAIGEQQKLSDYHNPAVDSPLMALMPIAFVGVFVILVYRVFSNRDLKPLSD